MYTYTIILNCPLEVCLLGMCRLLSVIYLSRKVLVSEGMLESEGVLKSDICDEALTYIFIACDETQGGTRIRLRAGVCPETMMGIKFDKNVHIKSMTDFKFDEMIAHDA